MPRVANTPGAESAGEAASAKMRQDLKEWLRDKVDGADEIIAPELAGKAYEHFRGDTELMATIGRAYLRDIAYRVTLEVLADTRRVIGRLTKVQTEEEHAAAVEKRWEEWKEHAARKHVSLLRMTRVELIQAATQREKHAHTQIVEATFLRALAARLTGPSTQTVRDVLTSDEIDQLHERIEKEVRAKNSAA